MKHVGILAHSAEGSALCYLALCHAGSTRLSAYHHPDVTMTVSAMGPLLPAWEVEDLATVRATLAIGVDRLKASGCDFFICPDNTAHLALESGRDDLALPGLHIAEVVTAQAARRGYRKLGVLGTKWTMGKSMYFDCARRHGMQAVAPPPVGQAFVNESIFAELCSGIFSDDTRRSFVRIITDFQQAGCDAVVLGCTEIPLLIAPGQSPIPVLDSTRLLAQVAMETALGDHAMPAWRGGPA